MKLRRWMIVIIVTVGIISAIVYGFMPKPVTVDLVKGSRGPLKVTVEEGKTRVKDRFVFSAPVAGPIDASNSMWVIIFKKEKPLWSLNL